MANIKVKDPTAMVVFTYEHKILTDRQLDNRIRKLSEMEARKKELEDAIKALKAEIVEGMDGDEVVTGRYVVRNTPYTRSSIDSAKFKRDFPELADQYTKVTECHKFTYAAV